MSTRTDFSHGGIAAPNSVNTTQLVNGAVTAAKIAANAGILASQISGGIGLQLLIRSQLGADATFDIQNLPGGPYLILGQLRSDSAAGASEAIGLRVNNDSGSRYDHTTLQVINTTVTGLTSIGSAVALIGVSPTNAATANFFGALAGIIMDDPAHTNDKTWVFLTGDNPDITTAANQSLNMRVGAYNQTAAITRLTFAPQSGGTNYKAGSWIAVYGFN